MKIINCGALNIDYVYSVDHMVKKGETLSSSTLETFCGGKGLNQSIALGKSGIPVWHAGMVGEEGAFLIEELNRAGVNTKLITRAKEKTGHAIIQRDGKGDNCILLYGGANQAITKEWINHLAEYFEPGDYLLLQNEISGVGYLMKKAKSAGMTIIFNPSPMDEKIQTYPLPFVDYFILNQVEAEGICQKSGTAEELLHILKEQFPQAGIVLTLGENGSVFLKDETILKQSCYPASVADTTAAGDTFTGYFLEGLLKGRKIEETLQRASRAAAIAVSRKGAAPSIPEAAELL